jgi:hypothetical protein
MGNTVEMRAIASLNEGQIVYISEQYYNDNSASVAEIPRFGWIIKSVLDNVATIEYQRHNLKLLMTLMVDKKYLKAER